MRFVLSRKEMYYVVFTMIPHAYLFVVDYLLKHMWWYQSYVMIEIEVDTLSPKDVNLLDGLALPLRPKSFVLSLHFVGLHLKWNI